jgi:hypothetical protein
VKIQMLANHMRAWLCRVPVSASSRAQASKQSIPVSPRQAAAWARRSPPAVVSPSAAAAMRRPYSDQTAGRSSSQPFQ